MSKFHVSQIETHVRGLYESEHWNAKLDDVANLSRLLGLHAVHLVLGNLADGSQIIEITDGGEDRGIDAIGVDPSAKLVVLVQSKWRQDGTGSIDLGGVLKFLAGVRSLLGMKSDEEPIHASETTKTAVRELLKTPGARIRLVTVSTASEEPSEEVELPIQEILEQLNDLQDVEPLAGHNHFGQAALFNSISEKIRPSVDIDLQMLDWGKASDPQRIFYGRVSAAEIASWFKEHGTDLFAENIRVVIPRSDINEGILSTIATKPDRFVYYNNGITILADTIETGPGGLLNRDVGYFKLTSASIVNGAQTVSTLGSAIGTEREENLGKAFVLVRCIEVPLAEEDLGRSITRYANTQNEVSSQDFAFLDPEQHRLVRELQVLGYEYLLRSAEVPKSKDPTKVIELRQAAIALACASPNASHSVVAKREVSRLFTDSYSALFNPSTDPLRLSRAVVITDAVDEILDDIERESDGVKGGVAVHGRRVIAHLVMKKIGQKALADPDHDLTANLNNLRGDVSNMVDSLVEIFPTNAYPGNVFKNGSRVSKLLSDADL
ncbi:AIPR family protein [Microbacterium sp. MYb72]|uniref:AIPR family protein n=1 Tax=Microbacterium sp. MYb72 TaxID=1848693 RepID=UPI0011B012F2|nr:AIPR family protein [Microbacterium sp. MYb72]